MVCAEKLSDDDKATLVILKHLPQAFRSIHRGVRLVFLDQGSTL